MHPQQSNNNLQLDTAELQRLKQHWNHESMFETGVVELMSVNHGAWPGGIIGVYIFEFL